MKKRLIILFLLLFVSTTAFSREIVVVMRMGNNMPYQYFPDNKEPTGLYVDIVTEAAKQLDVQLKIKKYPWKRCQKLVVMGDVQAIIGLFKKKEYQDDLYFAEEPLAYEEISFFKLKGLEFSYDGNIESLYPFTIGLTLGSSFGAVWEKHSTKFKKLDYAPHLDLLIKKLLIRRIPFIICDKLTFEYYSKINNMTVLLAGGIKQSLDQIVALQPSIGLNPGFLAFTKAENPDRNKQLSIDFAKAIRTVKKSDLFIELLEKYADF